MSEYISTLENIVECFHAAGFKVDLTKPETGMPYISSSISGLFFHFNINDTVNNELFKGHFVCFTGLKASWELVNKMNNELLYVKIILDNDNEATVEWDVLVTKTNKQHLISLIEAWNTWLSDAIMQLLKATTN